MIDRIFSEKNRFEAEVNARSVKGETAVRPFDIARQSAGRVTTENIDLIESFFASIERMDFETVGHLFTSDGLYRDEPTPQADAVGPVAITTKLETMLAGLKSVSTEILTVVAQDHAVMSQRKEQWHFPTGEVMRNEVMCIHVIVDGKISLWHEYWDLKSTMVQIPESWVSLIKSRRG